MGRLVTGDTLFPINTFRHVNQLTSIYAISNTHQLIVKINTIHAKYPKRLILLTLSSYQPVEKFIFLSILEPFNIDNHLKKE